MAPICQLRSKSESPSFTFSTWSSLAMAVSLLPTEVLEHIAQHLTTLEWCACQAVCRSWRPTFQTQLFSRVKIKTRKRLRSFLKLTASIGHFVKKLRISYLVPVLEPELDQLATELPNLTLIDINERYLQHMKFMRAFSRWTRLQKMEIVLNRPKVAELLINGIGLRLTSLSLRAPATQMLIDDDRLMQALPSLEHLCLSRFGVFKSSAVRIHPSRLVALHTFMPHLEYLEFYGVVLEKGDNIDATFEDLTFEKLTVLKLWQCTVSEPQWLEHFPRLFTHLETASFVLEFDENAQRDTHTANFRRDQRLSLALLTAFPDMQQITFESNHVTNEELLTTLKTIHATGRRFEAIHILGCYEMDVCKLVLDLQKPDIRKLQPIPWKTLTNGGDFVSRIRKYQFLETLFIAMEPAQDQRHLDVGDILSNLPLLKTMELYNCLLETKQAGEKQHPLIELELMNCAVSSSAMDYISDTCTHIKEIYLSDVDIESKGTTRIEINLPHCALEKCHLASVRVTGSDLELGAYPEYVTLLSITQLEKDSFKRLYNTFWIPLQRMGYKQVQRIEWIKTRDLTMEFDYDDWPNHRESDTPLTKNRWNEAIKYGIIDLTCASIKKLQFDSPATLKFK